MIERSELQAERGVAQYHRLASLLRHRIAKGEYPLGSAAAADHPAGRRPRCRRRHGPPGVRAAPKEGLIRSQRGIGTHVAALPAAVDDLDVAINDPFAAPQALPSRSSKFAAALAVPPELLGPEDRPAGDYVCIRKLHTYSGEPFCYAEIYVPASVFDALPKDAARKRKLLAAVLDALGPRCRRVRQRTTVMPADFPFATC